MPENKLNDLKITVYSALSLQGLDAKRSHQIKIFRSRHRPMCPPDLPGTPCVNCASQHFLLGCRYGANIYNSCQLITTKQSLRKSSQNPQNCLEVVLHPNAGGNVPKSTGIKPFTLPYQKAKSSSERDQQNYLSKHDNVQGIRPTYMFSDLKRSKLSTRADAKNCNYLSE